MREILISRDETETRVALLEDGRLAELYLQRPGHRSLVGNIYKGRVENVLAGMDAAFVDIGLERNGYLRVDEVVLAKNSVGRGQEKISRLLRSGMEILVQVARDGVGQKGPRLTMQLSLAGRCLVYKPYSAVTGASRRLAAEERERLRSVCRDIAPMGGGLIARTAAEGASSDDLAQDLRFLCRLWSGVVRRAAAAQAPCLVHTELELPFRAVRDLWGSSVTRVLVDDVALQRRVRNYLKAIAPDLGGIVQHYDGVGPLFEAYGLEGHARSALERRVELPSGGYLVIDHTEAMTVIDVNSGRFTGKRFLEDTMLRTNLEACREIVRQLRLRDIGGIIVIDFIDMNMGVNREAVLTALRAEAEADRTKTYVVALSPLGLVEMTRQNLTAGLRETMTSICPTCRGEGRVLSDESALIEVERRLLGMARATVTPGFVVEVHPRMAVLLEEGSPSRLSRVEALSGHIVILRSAGYHVPLDHVVCSTD